MFRKELADTIKTFVGILLLVAGIGIFSFFVTKYILGVEIQFGDIMSPLSWTSLVFVGFYLGSTIFSRERTGNTFEYFFSLPVAREKALFYKIFPRFLALLLFFLVYIFLGAVLYKNDPVIPLNPLIFFIILLSIFLFSISKSLMYRRNYTILISAIFGFVLMFIIVLIVTGVVEIREEQLIFTYFAVIFGVLSLALFIGFVWRFRGFDMSNMYRLSRRNVFLVMLPVAVFLFLFIGVNLLDTGKPADFYTAADLVPTSFAKSNGFYRLWTLSEPKGVDVNSDAVIDKYRKMFDPQFDNKAALRRFDSRENKARSKEIIEKMIIGLETRGVINPRVWKYLSDRKADLERMRQDYSFLLDRYGDLVHSPEVIDFSSPEQGGYPIFDLLLWLRFSRFYITINALDAVNGQWEHGVSNILAHIAMVRKVTGGSRPLIVNIIGKSLGMVSLQMLVALMNRDDCPPEVYEQILKELPPLKPGEFGTANSFIFEALAFANFVKKERGVEFRDDRDFFDRIRRSLFLQENRTIGYMSRYTREIIPIENTPPFQWKTDLPGRVNIYSGAFWWFFNPAGKLFFTHWNANLQAVVFKTYRLRSIYEMTRICAELHMKDDPSLPVQEVLKRLDTYKQTMDPCSGQPYKWNPREKVLYSIGTDRKDNNGIYDISTFNTDFVVHVRLKGRN